MKASLQLRPLDNTCQQISKYVCYKCYRLAGGVTQRSISYRLHHQFLVLKKLWTENMAGRESIGEHSITACAACTSQMGRQFAYLAPTPLLHYILMSTKHGLLICTLMYIHLCCILNSYYVATGSDCGFHTCTTTGRQLGYRQDITRGFINMLFLSCCSSDCLHPIILSAGQIHLICTRVLSRIMSFESKHCLGGVQGHIYPPRRILGSPILLQSMSITLNMGTQSVRLRHPQYC